jgi:hypothetical protein
MVASRPSAVLISPSPIGHGGVAALSYSAFSDVRNVAMCCEHVCDTATKAARSQGTSPILCCSVERIAGQSASLHGIGQCPEQARF